MAKFYVRYKATNEIISDLCVADLKMMAKDGRLKRDDRIRKSGHTTWHIASIITGLEFLDVDVTSVISIPDSEEASDSTTNDSTDNILFIRWSDGREDGPFTLSTIKELASDGFILYDCTFRSQDTKPWNTFDSLELQPSTSLYHVAWKDGRKDGPFPLSQLQALVNDGFVSNDCKFKQTTNSDVQQFNNMNLLDTYPIKTVTSEPISDKAFKEDIKKSQKQKKERVKWRKGWFRRFVVKTTASLVIIALIIGLGCWGVWTAMSDKQKELASNKFTEIKSFFTEDLVDISKPDSDLDSTPNTTQNTTASVGKLKTEANISVPLHGPLWVHEDLKMPVINSFTPKNSTTRQIRSYEWRWSWTPQLLLAMPPNPVTQNIQLKAYYEADQFGKNEWFWFPENLSVTRGVGRTNENTPEYSDDSMRLLQLGDLLGIWNQTIDKTSLVKSWFNLDIYNITNPSNDLNDLNNSNNYLSRIDDVTDGIINRIELGGNNYWANTDYLQFKRDQKNRVVAIERFDSGGNSGGEIIRFEYSNDNSLVHLYTHNLYSGSEYWTDWTPTYSNGKLTSLHGVDGKKEISAIYEYDSDNRINTIHVNWNTPHLMRRSTYIASFTYLGTNNYWSKATLTGNIVEDSAEKDLGSIRYEQTLINQSEG